MKKPNYGFPIFHAFGLILIGTLVILFLCMIVLLFDVSYFGIIFLTLLIGTIYFTVIIIFRRHFFSKRISILEKMIALAELSGNENILDLGTGSGILAIGFAGHIENGGRVYGLDRFGVNDINFLRQIIWMVKINYFGNNLRNALMNAEIKKDKDKCVFMSMDLTKGIKFPDCFFDIIISSQALSLISNQKQNNIFEEIDRVLKCGGRVIFFEPKKFRAHKWDILDTKGHFKKNKYDVKIIPLQEFKSSCVFFGKKI